MSSNSSHSQWVYEHYLDFLPFVLQMQIIEYLVPSFSKELNEAVMTRVLYPHLHRRYCKVCGNPLDFHPDHAIYRKDQPSIHWTCRYRTERHSMVKRKIRGTQYQYRVKKAHLIYSFCEQRKLGQMFSYFLSWDNYEVPIYLLYHVRQCTYYYQFKVRIDTVEIIPMINTYNINLLSNPFITIVKHPLDELERRIHSNYPLPNALETVYEKVKYVCRRYSPLLYIYKKHIIENISHYISLIELYPETISKWIIQRYYPDEKDRVFMCMEEYPILCIYIEESIINELYRDFPEEFMRVYRESIDFSSLLYFE